MADTFFPSGHTVNTPFLDTDDIKPFTSKEGWDIDLFKTSRQEALFASIQGFHTPHIQFGVTHYTSAFLLQGLSPENTVVITYADTEGVINYRNRKYEHHELIVITRDEEIDLVLSEKNDLFSIAIEENFFYTSFFGYFGRPFDGTTDKRLLLDPKQDRSFLQFLHRWLVFFIKQRRENALPIDHIKVEQEIMRTFFDFISIDKAYRSKENQVLKQARELLHENLDMDLKLSETFPQLGVSQCTLEYTFKKNLGMTPKAYLQILRLNAINKELKEADPKYIKVSDIALKYGFLHLGHFASEYQKIFGCKPVKTLHQTR